MIAIGWPFPHHLLVALAMAAVIHSTYCSACGGRHKLCLPDDDFIFSSREYEYECASTARTVRVPKGVWSVPDEACPAYAIVIREVKS
jgi:hypothetical protein